MISFMGIGTTLYGKKDFNPQDGFYTATKWFTLLMFPIIPFGSFRARWVSSTSQNYVVAGQSSTNYQLVKIPLDKKQVLAVYLGTYGSIGLFILLLFLFPDYAGYTVGIFGLLLIYWVVKIIVDDQKIHKRLKQ